MGLKPGDDCVLRVNYKVGLEDELVDFAALCQDLLVFLWEEKQPAVDDGVCSLDDV